MAHKTLYPTSIAKNEEKPKAKSDKVGVTGKPTVSYTEVRKIAEELAELGVVEFPAKKKTPANFISPKEAYHIMKELSGKSNHNRFNLGSKILSNKRISSKGLAVIMNCMGVYEQEFVINNMDRVTDPENLLETIRPYLRYPHTNFPKIKNHLKLLIDAEVITFDKDGKENESEEKLPVLTQKELKQLFWICAASIGLGVIGFVCLIINLFIA